MPRADNGRTGRCVDCDTAIKYESARCQGCANRRVSAIRKQHGGVDTAGQETARTFARRIGIGHPKRELILWEQLLDYAVAEFWRKNSRPHRDAA